MTELEAIHAAILREPGEDLHRLAYADRLDERGHEGDRERAEFIRVQVELAKTDPHQPGHDWDLYARAAGTKYKCRRESLAERELILANWKAWVPRLSSGDTYELVLSDRWTYRDTPAVAFTRGFVAEVRCDLATLLGGACRCNHRDGLVYDGLGAVNCPHCGGKGTTPGIAAELFARHPVVSVRVTDMKPDEVIAPTGNFIWWREVGRVDWAAWVPPDVFDAFPDPPRAESHNGLVDWHIHYPTAEAANLALSAAVVAYCRGRAGLPTSF